MKIPVTVAMPLEIVERWQRIAVSPATGTRKSPLAEVLFAATALSRFVAKSGVQTPFVVP